MFETEEDVKNKIIVPYLESIGFDKSELFFEMSFTIPGGKNFYRVGSEKPIGSAHPRLDILVKRRDKNLFIFEIKGPDIEITYDDIVQATSYAKLLHPPAPFCIITNGKNTRVIDSITREDIVPNLLNEPERYSISVSDDLYYEAAKYFLGYSRQNLLAFCEWQVATYMQQLKGGPNEPYKKYIEELYEPPESLQEVFQTFLSSHSNCFLLIGDSGMGKTCWMCYSAIKSLRSGRPTLFYRAFDIEQGILSAIGEDLNWSFSPEHSQSRAAKLFFEVFEKDGALIFIDGLDEIGTKEARRIIDAFLKKISGRNIKIIATCKSTSWEQLRQSDGIPTYVSEMAFRIDNSVGHALYEPSKKQFSNIIERYRNFYHFHGSFEEGVLQDCKRNLFLLRVMFEVASNKRLVHITYTAREFYDEYFKRIIERFDDRRESTEQILIRIAGVLYNHNQEMVSLDELREEIGISPLEQLPSRLFDINVLVREETGEYTRVGFYFNKLRDFLIAFRSLKWPRLSSSEFASLVHNERFIGLHQDVLHLYYTLANQEHKRVLDKSVYENASKYTSFYESLLNEHFYAFKGAFAPYEALPTNRTEPIGFLGFLNIQKKSVGYYGFRVARPNQEMVLLFPISEPEESNTARDKRLNLARITGTSRLSYRSSSKGFRKINVAKEVIESEIRGELDKITKRGMLDESQNVELLLERVLGIAVRHYGDYLGIRESFFSDKYLPLDLDRICKAVLYERALWVYEDEWREQRIADGRIVERQNGDFLSYTYQIGPDERQKLKAAAMEAADKGVFVKSRYIDDIKEDSIESIVTRDIACLKAMGISQITNTILVRWDDLSKSQYMTLRWKPETMKCLLEKIYTIFLNEYRSLVARNFPTLCNDFPLYKNMPVKYFIIFNDKLDPTGDIYQCRNSVEITNSVVICRATEIDIDRTEKTLCYQETKYKLFNQSWVSPSSLLHRTTNGGENYFSFEIDWHKSVLGNLVYDQIRDDLRVAFIEFAKRYGVEIVDKYNLFSR